MEKSIDKCLLGWPILARLNTSYGIFFKRIKSFLVLNGGYDVLVITFDNKVYGYGKNVRGMLGLGHTDKTVEPEEIVQLRAKGVIDLKHGSNYVIALTKNGNLYSWGQNKSGQLGHGNSSDILEPKLIECDEQFTMVRCGNLHNVGITRSGKVYCWGWNCYGQCGVGDRTNKWKLVKVCDLETFTVISIECGQDHTLALTSFGKVFSWGDYNRYGVLEDAKLVHQLRPVKLEISGCDVPMRSIACGDWCSMVLTEAGHVYIFQKNVVPDVSTNYYRFHGNRFLSIAAYGELMVGLCFDGFCYVSDFRDYLIRSETRKTESTSIADFATGLIHLKVQSNHSQSDISAKSNRRVSLLSTSIASSFDQPDSSDLQFEVDGQTIYVHRSILRIASNYLNRMLSDSWSQSNCIVIVNSYCYPVYHAYLHYLYTDSFQIEPDHLVELLDLAVSYLEDDLVQHCVDSLIQTITLNNCCLLYRLSVKYELEQFQQSITHFMARNIGDVLRSSEFTSFNAEECKELVLKLGPKI